MGTDEESKKRQLASLNQQLEALKTLQPKRSGAKAPGQAAQAAIDFTSATAVGTLVGYGFDRWQDTIPWGVLVGLLLGTAAGVKLMFEQTARENRRAQAEEAKQDNDKAQG